jgi:hypothetical protein
VSRALTMSYHPGMLMPKFYRPISFRSDGMRTWESYHCDRYRWCIREYELDFLKLPPPSPILGQPNPGNTASARLYQANRWDFCMLTSPHHCNLVSILFMYDVRMLADLSPRPCNMRTVAVCFLSAGTTKACRPAMVVTGRMSEGLGAYLAACCGCSCG